MSETNEYQPSLYEMSLKTLFPATASVFTGSLIINRQQLLLQLPQPLLMLALFLLFFALICLLSSRICEFFAEHNNLVYPTVKLWLYPTLAMFLTTSALFLFLNLSNYLLGRGFWSAWLGLTGQDTTSFFFSCFSSMIFFISLQFVWSTFKVFSWIMEVSRKQIQLAKSIGSDCNDTQSINDALDKLKERSEAIKKDRVRATKVNRYALLAIFLLSVGFASWISFFKPELILYYRAEIQLRTFLEPETAYETFRHLANRFPGYRFLDSVEYRMAWILDRRLNKHEKAEKSYQQFLKKFGYKNVWADEAVAGLVRLKLDKLDQPAQALFWTEAYLREFADGVMVPHMLLYRIRALRKLGKNEEALNELQTASQRYHKRKMQLINSEDRMFDLVSFNEILAMEKENLNF